jgi:hypothetical protein
MGPKTMMTVDGGFATRLWNQSGEAIIHGTACSASLDHDDSVILQSSEFDCVGFAYGEIPDGGVGWVVTSGVAEALLKDETAATRGYWAKAADTDGRIVVTTAPAGLGALSTSEHFREVGHCLESKDAGTDVLVKLLLHFL